MRKLIISCTIIFLMQFLNQPAFSRQVHTITDMAGRKIILPVNPTRIVCLAPGALRLIVYLNAQDKVVGVEDMEKRFPTGRPYWMANTGLAKLPRIGPGGVKSINKKPDLEALLSVNPDVIFVTYMEAALATKVQNLTGIPVVVLTYGGFATFDNRVFQSLKLAGRILNRSQRANEVVHYIQSLQNDLANRTSHIPKDTQPTVYIGGIGFRGSQGLDSTEKNYMPFLWTHVNNIVSDIPTSKSTHIFLGKEKLLKLDPDIIFIDGGGTSLIKDDYYKKTNYYNALKAFKTKQVFLLFPFNWYVTNIDTALVDSYVIGKIIFPEQFKDINLEEKSDEIYRFLTGKPVYTEMRNIYGNIGQIIPFLNN